ncbi:hypothetical protein [Cloacibacillus sp. An23]|uniref:hypothetical protein n=1 Tax=Cloacibacillus sp. An23 TaxID=1965591 RepID=UPI000B3A11E4|nr:hypothetical protein [Cloacibacillus sp. An23]OUO94389.1 hypothetical protein B5F39_03955 [Cloacibacillus sp. An23]
MEPLVLAGLFVFYAAAEYPLVSVPAAGALLWFLCRIDGGLVPLFAFAAYCALAAAAYVIGGSFIRTPWAAIGGLIPLGIVISLFPVIFGGLWWALRRIIK